MHSFPVSPGVWSRRALNAALAVVNAEDTDATDTEGNQEEEDETQDEGHLEPVSEQWVQILYVCGHGKMRCLIGVTSSSLIPTGPLFWLHTAGAKPCSGSSEERVLARAA